MFLTFYILRMTQFYSNTVFGVKMFQSNMIAVILAILGVFSLGSGMYATIATVILVIDAYIGVALFTAKNSQKIHKFMSSFKSSTSIVIADMEEEAYIRA